MLLHRAALQAHELQAHFEVFSSGSSGLRRTRARASANNSSPSLSLSLSLSLSRARALSRALSLAHSLALGNKWGGGTHRVPHRSRHQLPVGVLGVLPEIAEGHPGERIPDSKALEGGHATRNQDLIKGLGGRG
jgi:hypothetical protein